MQEYDLHQVSTKLALFSEDGSRVLVMHYMPNSETPNYGIPGGHIDGDELPEQALRRELQEELGATLGDVTSKESFRHQGGKIVIGFVGVAPPNFAMKPPDSEKEVGEWKTRDEFEQLDIEAYKKFVLDNWPMQTKSEGRHFLAVFFLSFMWGTFGVDRFYLGKIWTGLLKLVTLGGLGIWVIVDLVLIMSGSMRDKQGNEMRETARYKRFAAKTVLVFALVLGAMMLLTGGAILFAAYQLITALQNGGIESLMNLLPPGFAPPDINSLQ